MTTIEQLLDLSHFQDSPMKWAIDGKLPDFTDFEKYKEFMNTCKSETLGLSHAHRDMCKADDIIRNRMTELGLEDGKAIEDCSTEQLNKNIQMLEDVMDEQLYQIKTILSVSKDSFGMEFTTDFDMPKPFDKEGVGGPPWTDGIGLIPANGQAKQSAFTHATQSGKEASEDTRWMLFNIIWLTMWMYSYATFNNFHAQLKEDI